MLIRPFEITDQDDVIQLWQECNLVVTWNDPVKDIQRKLKVNPELFLVASTADNRIVGSIMGGYEGHRGWMNYLAVHPSQQKTGLGKQLVRKIEKELTELGCPKINLQVRTTNTDVIDFYESLGYSKDNAIGLGKRLIVDE